MLSRDYNAFMAKLSQIPDCMANKQPESESLINIRNIFQTSPEKGLGLLFRQLYDPLCSYAAHLVNTNQTAEQLVGNVFFQFYLTKAYKNGLTDYTAYLFNAVVNECYKYLKDQPEQKNNFSLLCNKFTGTALHYKNLMLRITEMMGKLSIQNQRIFSLFWLQNKSYFEIGQELKISSKTVEIQVSNTIQKFTASAVKKTDTYVAHDNSCGLITHDRLVNIDKGYAKRILNIKKSKFDAVFVIDPNSPLTFSRQLVVLVLRAVQENIIQDGDRMPSISKLSAHLAVSRDKIQKTYLLLKEIGILSAIHGNGYFILKHAFWSDKKQHISLDTLNKNERYDVFFESILNKLRRQD